MAESAGRVEAFEGKASEMRTSTTWLAAEDVLDAGGTVRCTIKRCVKCTGATFNKGRKENVHALEFRGAHKKLVLNATNRKYLAAHVNRSAKLWAGTPVVLYLVDTRNPEDGEPCLGIRLRLREGSELARQPKQSNDPEPRDPRDEDAP